MKLSRFWQRQRRDADLRQELSAYLEQETADRIAAGATPEEARYAAQRKLGNVTRIREDLYEQNSVVTLESLWRDVAYALRLFRRNPGFALIAILSVALGIGANSSVFTLLDQVMLRTLPVERPQRARAAHRRRVSIRQRLRRWRRAVLSDVPGSARREPGVRRHVLPPRLRSRRQHRRPGRATPRRARLRRLFPGSGRGCRFSAASSTPTTSRRRRKSVRRAEPPLLANAVSIGPQRHWPRRFASTRTR